MCIDEHDTTSATTAPVRPARRIARIVDFACRAGECYRQVESGKTVQFVGVASMPEVDGGDVGVFRFLEGGRCLIATKARYDQGQTFTPIEEYEEPDEATTAEWRAFVKGDEP